ncbi:MAG: sulfur-oxidizing protein SoxX [Candidatus Kentron sp. G]|nr:MAG: sulfur-oxidizing protein SoxX [Candidatus Kentron sp. G]VFM99384.1 MAG: sulfur-oxidizing protein SoxX [Candidatus Kentron sp. G]VFN01801.1 MAG: sulfur-oxidizing protein SoxX [Candidatus Kentron sp. G]
MDCNINRNINGKLLSCLFSPRLFACALLLIAGVSPQISATEMVAYEVVDFTIPSALTDKPGDPVNGRKAAIQRKKGNCLACHRMPIPEEDDHGATGPDLIHIASRASIPALRLRIVDPKRINPETMMPAFYRVDGLHRVAKKFQGKPILTAQEVEDLLAYLATLK